MPCKAPARKRGRPHEHREKQRTVISKVFHQWERRLASASGERVVRPFEWGCDWVDAPTVGESAAERLEGWASAAVADSDRFFALPPYDDYELRGDRLTYASAVETPHPENNLVHARL